MIYLSKTSYLVASSTYYFQTRSVWSDKQRITKLSSPKYSSTSYNIFTKLTLGITLMENIPSKEIPTSNKLRLPTTSKCPNAAELEEKSDTRLSFTNSKPSTIPHINKLKEKIIDMSTNLALVAPKKDISRRWIPDINRRSIKKQPSLILLTPRQCLFPRRDEPTEEQTRQRVVHIKLTRYAPLFS